MMQNYEKLLGFLSESQLSESLRKLWLSKTSISNLTEILDKNGFLAVFLSVPESQ